MINKPIRVSHIALQYRDKKDAETFFCRVLGLNKEKEFTLPASLGNSIFGIDKDVEIIVYSNEDIRFEIFFTEEKSHTIYDHICLALKNKQELINSCKEHGIEVKNIKNGEKTILFIKDFNGYLYEIKEMSKNKEMDKK